MYRIFLVNNLRPNECLSGALLRYNNGSTLRLDYRFITAMMGYTYIDYDNYIPNPCDVCSIDEDYPTPPITVRNQVTSIVSF